MNFELHSDVKLQNLGSAHFDSENRTHERDEELPNRDVHCDSDAERTNMETRTKLRLAKYVRRHHLPEQIIGNKEAKIMTRNRIRSETCLLRKVAPRIVSGALQNDDWY